MARRADDPLPVFKVGGIVRLNGDDLREWLERQRRRTIVGAAPATPSPALALLA